MLLKTGDDYQPDQAEIFMWQRLYPEVDVYQELNAMEGWCFANPAKRKTPKGIRRFINSWLNRAQAQAKMRPNAQTRDLSTAEMMETSWAN